MKAYSYNDAVIIDTETGDVFAALQTTDPNNGQVTATLSPYQGEIRGEEIPAQDMAVQIVLDNVRATCTRLMEAWANG